MELSFRGDANGSRERAPDDRLQHRARKLEIPGSALTGCPGMTGANYFLPARLSRNTPCSPNMFQNHQGRFSRSGRP